MSDIEPWRVVLLVVLVYCLGVASGWFLYQRVIGLAFNRLRHELGDVLTQKVIDALQRIGVQR